MDNDTLFCIFECLRLPDILNCFVVCRQFNEIVNNELIWKKIFINTFENDTIMNNFFTEYKKHFKLDNFLMDTIQKGFNECVNLQEIDFSDNFNSPLCIPCEIDCLHKLEVLDLSDNDLQSIPCEIGHLYNLKNLNLSYNSLRSIPQKIYQLHNLRKLRLDGNGLQLIPREVCQLHNLEELHLDHNELECIPEEICQLQNLKLLYLNDNHLVSIPESICQMHNLRNLYLFGNGLIQSIPECINQLKNIKIVSYGVNLLQKK